MSVPSEQPRDFVLPTNVDRRGYPVCPDCGFDGSEVTHTYPWKNGKRLRRRVCGHCGKPYNTIQTAEQVDM